MQLLFYVAKYGTLTDKIISKVTKGPYSHVELQFDNGLCFSSSPRDGGVRIKKININPEHWVSIPLNLNEQQKQLVWNTAVLLSTAKPPHGYDWAGVLRFVLPFVPPSSYRYFCSEVCLYVLEQAGWIYNAEPYLYDPNKLADYAEFWRPKA